MKSILSLLIVSVIVVSVMNCGGPLFDKRYPLQDNQQYSAGYCCTANNEVLCSLKDNGPSGDHCYCPNRGSGWSCEPAAQSSDWVKNHPSVK